MLTIQPDDFLELAYLRCSRTADLIGYAANLTDARYYLAVKALQERGDELTDAERQTVAEMIRTVMADSYRSHLPPKVRTRTDRFFGNLNELLDPTTRREIARGLCTHQLRVRRISAARILRRLGPAEEDIRALTDAWQTFHDPDVLFVLTRVNGGLAESNCCELLEFTATARSYDWDPAYLRAAILERLILDQTLDHDHAVATHPVAYVRAVGRTRQTVHEPFLLQAILKLSTPTDLALAASVAGRLRSSKLVLAIRTRLADIADMQPESWTSSLG